jgi:hypothetical protein
VHSDRSLTHARALPGWADCRRASTGGFGRYSRQFLADSAPAYAVVCRAERGRWRPQADDTGLTLTLTLAFALLD